MALRDRMIGALLRQAREEANISTEELGQMTAIPAENIERYELGELSLPMHELSVLASSLKKNVSYFLESSSHIGQLLSIREEWKHFTDLPEEVRKFAANPLNIGFIHIAITLSQMPTDTLRQVGTSMLDITM
jgi:transcriptional regulator with XRE-family HTH domain